MRTVEHPEIGIRLGEQHVEFDLVALRGFRLHDRELCRKVGDGVE